MAPLPPPPLFLICKNTRLTQSVGLTWGQVWTVIRVWVCQVLWHHVNLHPWPCECLLDGEVMTVCRSLSWREKAAKNRPRVGRMLVMHTKYTIHYICVSQHHLFSVHLFRMPSAWASFAVLPVHSQKVQSSITNENFCCSEVRGLLFRPEAPKNNNPAKIKKRMCLCHWATQRVVADLAVFWKSTSDRDSQKTGGKPLPHSWAVRGEMAQCDGAAGSEVVLTYMPRHSPGCQRLTAHLLQTGTLSFRLRFLVSVVAN